MLVWGWLYELLANQRVAKGAYLCDFDIPRKDMSEE